MTSVPHLIGSGDLARELGRVEILASLPEHARESIAGRALVSVFKRGAAIFLEGYAPSIFAVLRGRVAILTRPCDDVEVQVATRNRGDLVGETSLLLGHHTEEGRALERVVLARLEHDSTLATLRRHDRARNDLERALAARIAFAHARIGEVAIHQVKQRLLLLLAHLAGQARPGQGQGEVTIDRVTQEELARMVGASRVATARAIKELTKAGVIRTVNRRITVLQPTRPSRVDGERVALRANSPRIL